MYHYERREETLHSDPQCTSFITQFTRIFMTNITFNNERCFGCKLKSTEWFKKLWLVYFNKQGLILCLGCSQVSPRPFENIFWLLSSSSSLIQQFKLNWEKFGKRATCLFPRRDVKAAVLMRTMTAGQNGLIQGGDGTPRECSRMLLSVSAGEHLAERVARPHLREQSAL